MTEAMKRFWYGFRRIVGGPYFPTARHALLREQGDKELENLGRQGGRSLQLGNDGNRSEHEHEYEDKTITALNQDGSPHPETVIELRRCTIGTCNAKGGRFVLRQCYIRDFVVLGAIEIDAADSCIRKLGISVGYPSLAFAEFRDCVIDEVDVTHNGNRLRVSGNVIFDNVRFARFFELGKNAIHLPHHYRALVEELRKQRNTDAAYVAHAAELSTEESFKGFSAGTLFVRGYEFVSDFGQLLLRPFVLILIVFVASWCVAWIGGTSPNTIDAALLPGWKGQIVESPFWRSLYVASQHIFFPIGIMAKEPLVVVNDKWQKFLLVILSVAAVGLWAAVIVAIRRRLRMEP